MTQKEKLYVEDAIAHEKNMMELCHVYETLLEDQELVNFMKKEIKIHEKNLKKLEGVCCD